MTRTVLLVSALLFLGLSPVFAASEPDALFEMNNAAPGTGWKATNSNYAYGKNYLSAKCNGTVTPTTLAVFDSSSPAYGTITASSTGPYSVYVRWVSEKSSTKAARYVVYDGTAILASTPAGECSMDQTSRTGEWVYCTTVTLTKGNNAYVTVGNDCEAAKTVVADAVRFVKHANSLTFRGTWSSSLTYMADDVVAHLGSSYVSVLDTNTNNPPDSSLSAWTILAQKGSQGAMGPQGPQGVIPQDILDVIADVCTGSAWGPCPTTCSSCPKVVFVSSASYTGNLGGLEGAHKKCQALADAVGLKGTFKAWISAAPDGHFWNSPSNGFSQAGGPYVVRTGAIVADNWSCPIDPKAPGCSKAPSPSLRYTINRTEYGDTVAPGTPVWTATQPKGLPETSTSYTCGGWTSSSQPGGYYGRVGPIDDTGWTHYSHENCNDLARIYCFQQ